MKSIKINNDIHKKLKIFCSNEEMKISYLVEKIITEYINKQQKNDNK